MWYDELLAAGWGEEAFLAMGIGMIIFIIVVFLAFYVYMALAWSTIARKLKYKKPWLAWIPIANFFLIPILAKKHWAWGFLLLIPFVNLVFFIIWTWNIYEQRKYPGWLALAPIIGVVPLIGWIGGIAQLVITGLVAWKDM